MTVDVDQDWIKTAVLHLLLERFLRVGKERIFSQHKSRIIPIFIYSEVREMTTLYRYFLFLSLCLSNLLTTRLVIAAETNTIEVTCESWNQRETICNIPSYYQNIVLAEPLSEQSCANNWRHTRSIYNGRYLGAIIVENGCRGLFSVNLTEPVNVQHLECRSDNAKAQRCPEEIDLAWIKERHSNSSCRWGEEHGQGGWFYLSKGDAAKNSAGNSYIKVTRGCRATFSYIANLSVAE